MKNAGFSHLKTSLFTIKTSFWGPMVHIRMHVLHAPDTHPKRTSAISRVWHEPWSSQHFTKKIRSKQKCHINYLRNTSKDLLSSPQFQYDFWHWALTHFITTFIPSRPSWSLVFYDLGHKLCYPSINIQNESQSIMAMMQCSVTFNAKTQWFDGLISFFLTELRNSTRKTCLRFISKDGYQPPHILNPQETCLQPTIQVPAR